MKKTTMTPKCKFCERPLDRMPVTGKTRHGKPWRMVYHFCNAICRNLRNQKSWIERKRKALRCASAKAVPATKK